MISVVKEKLTTRVANEVEQAGTHVLRLLLLIIVLPKANNVTGAGHSLNGQAEALQLFDKYAERGRNTWVFDRPHLLRSPRMFSPAPARRPT